jgi:hypothetical protein
MLPSAAQKKTLTFSEKVVFVERGPVVDPLDDVFRVGGDGRVSLPVGAVPVLPECLCTVEQGEPPGKGGRVVAAGRIARGRRG